MDTTMVSDLLMLSPGMVMESAKLSPATATTMAGVLLMQSPDMDMATMASARLSLATATTMGSVLLSPTMAMATMVRALPEEKKPQRAWDDGEEGAALHSDRPQR